MITPRVGAAIFVFTLIAVLAVVGIGLVNGVGPLLVHGAAVQHNSGKIVNIGPSKDFVLQTPTQQKLHFTCTERCLTELSHMQRHLTEKANTDVYYIQGMNDTLVAIDVD
jgi:hypothetical protein